jgi:hydrogenase expression/formation protein HypC
MCLAIPGRVLEIDRTSEPVMGRVSFGGVEKRVCLEWVPAVAVGDYVIVHVGFAISRMDEQEAKKTLTFLEQIADVEDELREEN